MDRRRGGGGEAGTMDRRARGPPPPHAGGPPNSSQFDPSRDLIIPGLQYRAPPDGANYKVVQGDP